MKGKNGNGRQVDTERSDIPDVHQWNLSPLFESDHQWQILFDEVESQLPSYQKYRGLLKDSIEVFKQAIEFHLGLTRLIEKLYAYAHLKNDEDRANQIYTGLQQKALNLLSRASEAASFFTPEIQSIPDEIIRRFIKDESLSEYGFFLEKILRYKPHTRSESEEQILAMSRELAGAPSQTFGQLDNVDLKFGNLDR